MVYWPASASSFMSPLARPFIIMMWNRQSAGPSWNTVWVDGPTGGGKTTLIERLLASERTRTLAAIRVGARGHSGQAAARGETTRYKAAGAASATAVSIEPDDHDEAVYKARRTALDVQGVDAVLVEGSPGSDPGRDGLAVCVLRPLPDGEPLVYRGRKELTRLDLGTYLTMVTGENVVMGEPPPDVDEDEGEVVEEIIEIPDDVAATLTEALEKGVPIGREGWCVRDGYEGVVYGTVYVINVFSESERPAAERLAAAIKRVRADRDILRDFQGSAGESRRISVFIANLKNPADPDLKKVLARVKRGLARTEVEW